MTNSIFPASNGADRPLPGPTVTIPTPGTAPQKLTPEAVRAILINPTYAGFGPFPATVDDATWVRASAKLIAREGAEQFLVNLLYVLRQSFEDGRPLAQYGYQREE